MYDMAIVYVMHKARVLCMNEISNVYFKIVMINTCD